MQNRAEEKKETRVVLPRALANARVIAPRIENGGHARNSRKEIVPPYPTGNGHANVISAFTFANCF